MSSPCGSQSASQSGASEHPRRVFSVSCDYLLIVFFGRRLPLNNGFVSGGQKDQIVICLVESRWRAV